MENEGDEAERACHLLPRKHEAFPQCWFDVGPTSQTSDQHQNNIGEMPRVCLVPTSPP